MNISSRLPGLFLLAALLSGSSGSLLALEFRDYVGSADADWNLPENWSPSLVPDSFLEGARIEAEGVRLGTSLEVGGLVLGAAGGFALDPGVELRTGSLFHQGGLVTGSGRLIVSDTGTISSDDLVVFHDASLRNEGTMQIEASLDFQNGGDFENAGQVELTDDVIIMESSIPRASVLENTGSIRKLVGPGRGRVTIPLVNEGVVACDAGVLELSGGGMSEGGFETGPAGVIHITGESFTLLNGAGVGGEGSTRLDFCDLVISSGHIISMDHFELGWSGRILGAGELSFLGSDCRLLEAGTLGGDVLSKVEPGSLLSVRPGEGCYIRDRHELRILPGGRLLLPTDESTVPYATSLSVRDSGLIRNHGFLEFADASGLGGDSTVGLINEAGATVLKTGDAGGNSWVGCRVESAGLWQLEAGSMGLSGNSRFTGPILLGEGTAFRVEGETTLGAGASIHGSGVLEIWDDLKVSEGAAVAADHVSLEDEGKLGGKGTLRVSEVMHIREGGFLKESVTLEISEGGEFECFSGGIFDRYSNAKILNLGMARFHGGEFQSAWGVGAIENRGVMEIASDGALGPGQDDPLSLVNSGILMKTAESGGESVLRFDLIHSGTFEVRAGVLNLDGAHDLRAPINVWPGALLELGSRRDWKRTITMREGSGFVGEGTVEHGKVRIEIEDGVRIAVNNYRSVKGAELAGGGTFVLDQSGSLEVFDHFGDGVTEIPQGRSISVADTFSIDAGRTLRVNGTLELGDSLARGAIFGRGVSVDVSGTIDITRGVSSRTTGIPSQTMRNEGVIRCRPRDTGFMFFDLERYSGNGLLAVEKGTLALSPHSVDDPLEISGRIEIHTGATLRGTLSFSPGSTLSGGGTVHGYSIFAGVVSPGMSIGTLEVSGSADFDGGILLAEVGAGGASDLLNISSTVDLSGGRLEVVPVSGYTPTVGESWTVLEAASISGTFDAIAQPPAGSGFGYFVSYTATSVEVTYAAIDSFQKAYEAATGVTLGPGEDLAALAEQNLDGDALPNLLDWAFGGSLSAPDPGRSLIIESVTPGDPRTVALRYPINPLATDVILEITGDDGLTGEFVPKAFTPSGTATVDGILFQQGALGLPSSDGSRFFRIEATLDAP